MAVPVNRNSALATCYLVDSIYDEYPYFGRSPNKRGPYPKWLSELYMDCLLIVHENLRLESEGYAVAVISDRMPVGYLPKAVACSFLPLMKDGVKFEACPYRLEISERKWDRSRLLVDIYRSGEGPDPKGDGAFVYYGYTDKF